MGKKLYLPLKVLFSFGLIALLFLKTDINSLFEKIRSINLYWLVVMLTLAHLNILISSIKWGWLLKALGISVELIHLFLLYLIGTFFNNFLPTMIGGDLVRIHQLIQKTSNVSSVIAATFAERFLGITALITFILLILFNKSVYQVFPAITLLAFVVFAGYLLIILLLLQQKYQTYLSHFVRFKVVKSAIEVLFDSHLKIIQYKEKKNVVIASYILSLIFYLIAILTVYAAAESLDIQIEMTVIMVVVPLVLLMGLLPISLNGLGINEGSYVFFFALFGISSLDAFSIALLLRARILLTGVLGGFIFMIYRGPNIKYRYL